MFSDGIEGHFPFTGSKLSGHGVGVDVDMLLVLLLPAAFRSGGMLLVPLLLPIRAALSL